MHLLYFTYISPQVVHVFPAVEVSVIGFKLGEGEKVFEENIIRIMQKRSVFHWFWIFLAFMEYMLDVGIGKYFQVL